MASTPTNEANMIMNEESSLTVGGSERPTLGMIMNVAKDQQKTAIVPNANRVNNEPFFHPIYATIIAEPSEEYHCQNHSAQRIDLEGAEGKQDRQPSEEHRPKSFRTCGHIPDGHSSFHYLVVSQIKHHRYFEGFRLNIG